MRATPPAPSAPPTPRQPPAPRRPEPRDREEEGIEPPAQRNGMGTPALVLGLLAAATCWTGWAGVVLGLPAVVAGFLGARRAFRTSPRTVPRRSVGSSPGWSGWSWAR